MIILETTLNHVVMVHAVAEAYGTLTRSRTNALSVVEERTIRIASNIHVQDWCGTSDDRIGKLSAQWLLKVEPSRNPALSENDILVKGQGQDGVNIRGIGCGLLLRRCGVRLSVENRCAPAPHCKSG
jgi:hypothetical protein